MKTIEKNLFTDMEISEIPKNILEFASEEAKKYFNKNDFGIWIEKDNGYIKVSKHEYGIGGYIGSYFFNEKGENITSDKVKTF